MSKTKKDKQRTQIVGAIRRGWDTQRIAKQFKVTPATVGAYRAHLTMGNI